MMPLLHYLRSNGFCSYDINSIIRIKKGKCNRVRRCDSLMLLPEIHGLMGTSGECHLGAGGRFAKRPYRYWPRSVRSTWVWYSRTVPEASVRPAAINAFEMGAADASRSVPTGTGRVLGV